MDFLNPNNSFKQLQDIQKLLNPNGVQNQQPVHTKKLNGRAGAEAYNMPPDSDDIFLDANEPIVWLIKTDSAGYKSIYAYDISIHQEVSETDTIKSLENRIAKLEEAMRNGKSNYSANYGKSKQYNQSTKPAQSGQYHDAGDRSDDQG